MYHVPIKSYSGLKKQSKWPVQLPGIDLSHDKNAIFAVTGSGVGRWPQPRYLKKNQNAPRPSEHPPVWRKKCQNV